MIIRSATFGDRDAIWAIFREVVQAGDTYAFVPDTPRDEALRLWVDIPRATYVAEVDSEVLGTYYIKNNQPGLGALFSNLRATGARLWR